MSRSLLEKWWEQDSNVRIVQGVAVVVLVLVFGTILYCCCGCRRRRRERRLRARAPCQSSADNPYRTTQRFDSPPMHEQPVIIFHMQSTTPSSTIDLAHAPRTADSPPTYGESTSIYPTAPPPEPEPAYGRRY